MTRFVSHRFAALAGLSLTAGALALGGCSSKTQDDASATATDIATDTSANASDAAAGMENGADSMATGASNAMDNAGAMASDAADSAGDAADRVGRSVKNGVNSARDTMASPSASASPH